MITNKKGIRVCDKCKERPVWVAKAGKYDLDLCYQCYMADETRFVKYERKVNSEIDE